MYKWRLWCSSYRQRLLLRRKGTLIRTDAVPRTSDRGYCWGEKEHLYGQTPSHEPVTEVTAEEKRNTCTDRRRPTNHWRPQTDQENLDSRIKTYRKTDTDDKEGTGKSRMGRGHWVTDGWYNRSELSLLVETDMAVVMLCPIGFEFSTSRALHCW